VERDEISVISDYYCFLLQDVSIDSRCILTVQLINLITNCTISYYFGNGDTNYLYDQMEITWSVIDILLSLFCTIKDTIRAFINY